MCLQILYVQYMNRIWHSITNDIWYVIKHNQTKLYIFDIYIYKEFGIKYPTKPNQT